eukprot:2064541-Heterocapsa_arctica.AAC.1
MLFQKGLGDRERPPRCRCAGWMLKMGIDARHCLELELARAFVGDVCRCFALALGDLLRTLAMYVAVLHASVVT